MRLSSFREIERLPGPAHPALYRSCIAARAATSTSPSSVTTTSTGPRSGSTDAVTYVNLMTSRRDDLSAELADLASLRSASGEWPWSFYCYLEDVPRPVTPSSFRLLEPVGPGRRGRRQLPGMRLDDDQSRDARRTSTSRSTRTRSVGVVAARLRGRCARDDRRVPRRARHRRDRFAAAGTPWPTDGVPSGEGSRAGTPAVDHSKHEVSRRTNVSGEPRANDLHLLRDCLALGHPERRPPVREGATRGGARAGARAQAPLEPERTP